MKPDDIVNSGPEDPVPSQNKLAASPSAGGPEPVSGPPAARRFAVLTATVPLGIALLVFLISILRLRAESAQAAGTEARLASRWLADRLNQQSPTDIRAIISSIATDSKTRVGVFDAHGSPIASGSFLELESESIQKLITSAEATLDLEENRFVFAASPFTIQGGQQYVTVASQVKLDSHVVMRTALYLGLLALISILVSLLYGGLFGRDLTAYFAHLLARFRTMAEEVSPPKFKTAVAGPEDEFGRLSSAVRELESRFRGELAIYQDAMEEVNILSQKRTEFLSDVACELHAPLKQIAQMVGDLLEDNMGPLKENQKEDVQIISTANDRLMSMVNDIMDLSSLIAKGLAPGNELVNLREVVAEVVDTARGGIGSKDIKIVLDSTLKSGPFVRGDRQRLWQVFTNLVSNALKFTEKGEIRVDVSSGRQENEASVVVSDTGVGIPEEHWQLIFDPFHQRGSTTKKLKGTGLGLAISKRIIELYKGSISVTAEEGKGSKFTVLFPCEKTR